ncbi:MAG: site-specific DNA-methyltransferase [Prevotellaceae bacterium]|jgi:DNA modification methylase|nr:site-specific DNA-methyltransferase [Prevotellaceae bacterium]
MKYKTVKNTIPENIDFGTILSINTNSVTQNTHGFHKYPAKFIPQIPQWAINKYLKNETDKLVLDPFCGSGTTLVESALSGNFSIGVDIDPLSTLISKVKTTKIDIEKLDLIVAWLKKNIENPPAELFVPDCQTLEHWFTKDAINKLSIIRTLINQIVDSFKNEKEVKDIQDLLFICFSSIIRRVSNADNESQKTYVSHTKTKQPEEVFMIFFSQLDYFVERITEFSLRPNLKSVEIIVSSSAGSLANLLKCKKVDLAITSPPYIKTIDYIYNQMAELFWIGDLFQMQTQYLQNEKKTQYIGNKQILKKEFTTYSPYISKTNIDLLDTKLQQVFETDEKNGHKHSYVAYKYFVEMEKHFAEISKCLKKKAHYVMIVGDSKVSDIYFDTADFLTIIAERNGFKLKNKWGYKIKNRFMRFDRKGRGGIIDIDWVLELEKSENSHVSNKF